ncbi:hypothetical protein REPUB_Repub01dG0099300 [Reevesia pubescens]
MLDPRINRRAFSEEEEERLLAAHRLYGNKWTMIARLFPGTTDNAVKNHWHAFPKGLDVTVQNNACSDQSTISSNIDESASTCTDLSLTHSSAKVPLDLSPVLVQFSKWVHHVKKAMTKGNGDFDKFYCNSNVFYKQGPMGVVISVNQSTNSSNSATES